MTDKDTQDKTEETPKMVDNSNVHLIEHLLITDGETGETILNKRV